MNIVHKIYDCIEDSFRDTPASSKHVPQPSMDELGCHDGLCRALSADIVVSDVHRICFGSLTYVLQVLKHVLVLVCARFSMAEPSEITMLCSHVCVELIRRIS